MEQLREFLYREPDAVGHYNTEDFFPKGLPPPPMQDALSLLRRAMEMGEGLEQKEADCRHLVAVFQEARRVD